MFSLNLICFFTSCLSCFHRSDLTVFKICQVYLSFCFISCFLTLLLVRLMEAFGCCIFILKKKTLLILPKTSRISLQRIVIKFAIDEIDEIDVTYVIEPHKELMN